MDNFTVTHLEGSVFIFKLFFSIMKLDSYHVLIKVAVDKLKYFIHVVAGSHVEFPTIDDK